MQICNKSFWNGRERPTKDTLLQHRASGGLIVVPLALLLCLTAPLACFASGETAISVKSAVVVQIDDPELRADLETRLVTKALEHRYDAVTTFDLATKLHDVNDSRFTRTLAAKGIEAVLVLQPIAIGKGSALESVSDEVPSALLARIHKFAGEARTPDSGDVIAVVHVAIYTLEDGDAHLVSSGAVWLDQAVADRNEGIERLENLIIDNVNAVRPAIRRHFGLPRLQ